jgi:hypothetical protein
MAVVSGEARPVLEDRPSASPRANAKLATAPQTRATKMPSQLLRFMNAFFTGHVLVHPSNT